MLMISMNTAELLARIAPEPGKMGGRPLICGRRVTPSMVLTMLANCRRKVEMTPCVQS